MATCCGVAAAAADAKPAAGGALLAAGAGCWAAACACISAQLGAMRAASGARRASCCGFCAGGSLSGTWADGAEAADINACHRSPSGRYVATGDTKGGLALYNYPCAKKGAQSIRGLGHSSHVMNVRFKADTDECLVTCGGNDRCIMRWGLAKPES